MKIFPKPEQSSGNLALGCSVFPLSVFCAGYFTVAFLHSLYSAKKHKFEG